MSSKDRRSTRFSTHSYLLTKYALPTHSAQIAHAQCTNCPRTVHKLPHPTLHVIYPYLLSIIAVMLPVSIEVIALSSQEILVGWTGSVCIQQYVLSINGTDITTSGTSYTFSASAGSVYDIQLTSFNYFGRALGNLPFVYRLQRELNYVLIS